MTYKKITRISSLFGRNKPFKCYRSYVENPSLIHHSARIYHCNISGYVSLGEKSSISDCMIRGNAPIEINRFTILTGPISIVADISPISIGAFCSIAPSVRIYESNHNIFGLTTSYLSQELGYSLRDDISSNGPVNIGHDVWIGAAATILSGVSIGNGVVIGANSVVTKDCEPFCVYAGNPARKISDRFPDTLKCVIQDSEWWNWSIDKIKDRETIFRYRDLRQLSSGKDLGQMRELFR